MGTLLRQCAIHRYAAVNVPEKGIFPDSAFAKRQRRTPMPTSIADFVRENLRAILHDWDTVAAQMQPAADDLDRDELRDFAQSLLMDVLVAMPSADGSNVRMTDEGWPAQALTRSSREHAEDRLGQGFTIAQLMIEYRALRWHVVTRWSEQVQGLVASEVCEEIKRFDAALDKSLVESVQWFHEQLNESRDLLLGALAHDLRNPLAVSLHTAQLLRKNSDQSSRSTEGLSRISEACTRMQRLIDDVLDFARLRFGLALPIKRERLALYDCIMRCTQELYSIAPDGRIEFEHDGDLIGSWDPARMDQLLMNLLTNAVRHAPNGEPVRVHARGDQASIRFTVHNRGDPIPPELHQHVFEPMRQGTDTPVGAAGLGLYIARQIVLAHGGSITFDSTADEGTTFDVMLPRC
jgi:signal transduction histidine kinase